MYMLADAIYLYSKGLRRHTPCGSQFAPASYFLAFIMPVPLQYELAVIGIERPQARHKTAHAAVNILSVLLLQ